MTLEQLQPTRLGAGLLAAALLVAVPAAHAFTMNTLSNPGSGPDYSYSGDQLGDSAKRTTTTEQSVRGLQFNVGPSHGAALSDPVGRPLDQSHFNDR